MYCMAIWNLKFEWDLFSNLFPLLCVVLCPVVSIRMVEILFFVLMLKSLDCLAMSYRYEFVIWDKKFPSKRIYCVNHAIFNFHCIYSFHTFICMVIKGVAMLPQRLQTNPSVYTLWYHNSIVSIQTIFAISLFQLR